MDLKLWRPWAELGFFPLDAWDYSLLGFFGLLTLLGLFYWRRDFARLSWREMLGLIGLLLVPTVSSRAFHLLLPNLGPDLLPLPGLPLLPPQPFVALLEGFPILVAAVWLGGGPAMLVGLMSGILHVGMTTGGITDPFYFVLLGFLVGYFLRQAYRGSWGSILRQPTVAGPLAVLVAAPAFWLSVFVRVSEAGLAGMDYAVTLTVAYLLPLVVEMALAGLMVQVAYWIAPAIRPVQAAYETPPYARTLNGRLLFIFVPLILLITLALLYAVTVRTLNVSTDEVVSEMEREATGAAEDILYFIHTGQALIQEFARDTRLWQEDPAMLQNRLQGDLRTLAFFSQLSYFGQAGDLIAAYPAQPEADALTTEEEILLQRVLQTGAVQISQVHQTDQGVVILSFLTPVREGEADTPIRALVGRVRLDINPMLNRVLTSLQQVGSRDGLHAEGFLVEAQDGAWTIIAHPDDDLVFTTWRMDRSSPQVGDVEQGTAYESRHPRDNTRQLVYSLPVEGFSSWAVVLRLPYAVVLEQATQIATPLLLLQVLLGASLIVAVPTVTNLVTRPLKQLAAAAGRIAEGDLDQPVEVAGEDEVAQVGDAFEGMRVRLKGRLEDLSLLLEVSQAVSATLELPEGMPFILEGALKATNAQVARIVLLSVEGEPEMVMARGRPRDDLGGLDRAVVEAASGLDRPLVIENLDRARGLLGPEAANDQVRALVALPVRTKYRVAAVVWVGYRDVRRFDGSEIDLLSTLSSQTAVLLENARLFQAAEGGRRRLAAILSSTNDAVLVTDRDDRILLVNPAAERAFRVIGESVIGEKVTDTALAPVLGGLLGETVDQKKPVNEELPLPDGRTLYANVSIILSPAGERIGRVAVMRDITRFKELDELKSEFVATVSHDLRAPLTFMRGYASMLPMVGDLSEKQRDYVERILEGVGQMGELVDDLLDLGRVEAGVGMERKPCHLGAILVEGVDAVRARAAAKELDLELDPAGRMAVVLGDASLLRQVVTNLVDNAVKYTPEGGAVRVGLSLNHGRAVISVADTGIGISNEDQVRLFEKFYRVKRRETEDIPGTGLGLAIVKSIVERHNGRVWVESELNEGSTFYVSLPLQKRPRPAE